MIDGVAKLEILYTLLCTVVQYIRQWDNNCRLASANSIVLA
jgi:hypothetical protein